MDMDRAGPPGAGSLLRAVHHGDVGRSRLRRRDPQGEPAGRRAGRAWILLRPGRGQVLRDYLGYVNLTKGGGGGGGGGGGEGEDCAEETTDLVEAGVADYLRRFPAAASTKLPATPPPPVAAATLPTSGQPFSDAGQ